MSKKQNVPSVRKNGSLLQARLGAAVRDYRTKLGITQEELAWRADMHRTYLADIERGSRNITLRRMANLARALRVGVEALLFEINGGGEGFPHQDRVPSCGEIMLIEDNPQDTELALRAFRHANVLNLITVITDGGEALEYLFCTGRHANRAGCTPQLVLLDLHLPTVSGLDVLRGMRMHEATRNVPVVVLTVSRHESDIATCKLLGATDYMVKPVEFVSFARVASNLDFQWTLLPPVTSGAPGRSRSRIGASCTSKTSSA